MRIRFLTLTILCFLGLTAPAEAQDADRGQLYEMSMLKVNPVDRSDFMKVVGMVKEAAEAAHLPAEHGWQMWMRDSEIVFVGTVDNMAAFDDPNAFMRAMAGTPGEEMMEKAMETMEAEVWARNISREIWELEEGWSYAPAQPRIDEVRFAEMHEFWVKPRMEEEFETLAGEIMAFFAKMDGRYAVNGFRTHFGDTGRATFVVLTDDWGEFYGEYAMDKRLESAGMASEWEALMAKFSDCFIDSKTSQWTYLSDLSYSGPGM